MLAERSTGCANEVLTVNAPRCALLMATGPNPGPTTPTCFMELLHDCPAGWHWLSPAGFDGTAD